MRLGVSPAATSTPKGVFIQRFEALFPGAGALGCGLLHSPTIPPGLSVCECGATGSVSCCTACPIHSTVCQVSGSGSVALSPVHLSCPYPPLLAVWRNVSSLSPWLLDFCAVRFSVSSGCFFVFKLLLSFFWLCEEVQCVSLCLHLGSP